MAEKIKDPETTPSVVTLKVKGSDVKQEFKLAHANRLVALGNSQWELADDKFQMNGSEIAKAEKK